MARLVFSMNQSLDGYVDHDAFAPGPKLFRHFVDQVGALAGSIYGTRMYGIMRYFDEENPDWDEAVRDFGAAWRRQHKWVVSNTLTSVGPNATLVTTDIAALAHKLKAEIEGNIDVAGPVLARSFTDLGLIDEYSLYFHPVVLGTGRPFFTGPRPRLRLVSSTQMDEDVVRLTYVPV